MPEYRLSLDAELDLYEIAVYTIECWGTEQADRYGRALLSCFSGMAAGTLPLRRPVPQRPDLLARRCEHHFVFALRRTGEPLLILAVLHERMDLMERLRDRLDP